MEQPEQNTVTGLQQPGPAAQPQAPPAAEPQAPAVPQPQVPSDSGDLVFDVDRVSCYYGSFRAVTDVSLSIHENEITAFIGPSGCGKTTVLRTLKRMNDLVVGDRVEGEHRFRGVYTYSNDVIPIFVSV